MQLPSARLQSRLSLPSLAVIIEELICFSLVLLFIYAGVSKLLDYEMFNYELGKSPFITKYATGLSWALPVIEIIIALALAIKKFRIIALYGSLFLMVMFSLYIWAMMTYSYDLPCSCGGILSKMGWVEHLWFNVAFVILTVVGIFLSVRNQLVREN
jgi:uncharacterized membrane protein YphA (DoxX/SURF4 family)